MPVIFFLVFMAIVAFIVYAIHAAAQRRKMLADWAARHGLRFDKERIRDFHERFDGLECLKQGHSRYAYNTMRGDWGTLPIIAFDYHYATGSGKNKSDYYFSAVIIDSPILLKPLRIRREGFFDKIGEFFGFDDIDFESAEFSRMFHVKSSDKRWAYDIIHQRMMEYLMAAPDLAIQFDTQRIIAWSDNTLKPRQFEAAAEHIRTIIDLIPEYVVEQQTGMA